MWHPEMTVPSRLRKTSDRRLRSCYARIALREASAHYARRIPNGGWWKSSSIGCGVSSNVEQNAIPMLDDGTYARVISFFAELIGD